VQAASLGVEIADLGLRPKIQSSQKNNRKKKRKKKNKEKCGSVPTGGRTRLLSFIGRALNQLSQACKSDK
jgi:hypothetical protein